MKSIKSNNAFFLFYSLLSSFTQTYFVQILNKATRAFFLYLMFFSIVNMFAQDSVITLNQFRGSRYIGTSYDGGYVIFNAPYTDNLPNRISKISRKGEVLWTKKPLINDNIMFTDMDHFSNGDIVISCEISKYWSPYHDKENSGGAHIDGALIRLNTCGDIEWTTIATVAGNTKTLDPLRKMDISINDEIWVNHYSSAPSILRDSIFGPNQYGENFIMNKYNSDGELLAHTEDLFISSGYIREVIALDDGSAIVCGDGDILPYYNQVYDPDSNFSLCARSVVVKLDQDAEIDWYYVYRWDEDQVKDPTSTDAYAEFEKFIASRSSAMLETDSNTYIVSGMKYYIDTVLNTYYYKHLLYELDSDGVMIRDTLYDDTKCASYSKMEYLNDTTLIVVQNPTPFDEWGGDPHNELEVRKIDARTWDILGEFSDTALVFYPISELAISHEGKILIVTYRHDGIGTQIRVIDPVTMTLDTIPSTDTNSYDYLCSGPYSTEDIELPPDTSVYEPIGLVHVKNIEIDVLIKNKTLYFRTNGYSGFNYKIFNSIGQPVLDGVTLEEQKEVSFLPSGVYFIEFMSPDKIEPIKFVIE